MEKLMSNSLCILFIAVFFSACTNAPENGDTPSDNPDQQVEKIEKPVVGDPEEEELGETKGLDLNEDDFDLYGRKSEKALYVYAQSGLNMRESADPKSNVLQVVPYGAKVTVIEHPKNMDMVVDGFTGGMAKVEFKGQTGYMFDGYMARFPAPKKEMQPKEYVEYIKKTSDKIAIYHHERLDDEGYIQNTEGLIVPLSSFDEAFLIAKVLFGIPEGITLPPPSMDPETIVQNPKKEEYLWSDELLVNRDDSGETESLYYYLRGEGGGFTVIIEPDERGMKIAETAIAD